MCPSGGDGTRQAGSAVAESLVSLYRVDTHEIRRGRRAVLSSANQGSPEPLCARIKGVLPVHASYLFLYGHHIRQFSL